MENRGEEDRTPARGGPATGRGVLSMSFVLRVDPERRPLAPVHPGHARRLLSHGTAPVLHPAPFALILKRACREAEPEALRLKLDPGSKTTGLAVVDDGSGQVV